MTQKRFGPLGIVLIMILLAGMACNLSGDDDDDSPSGRRTPTSPSGMVTLPGTPGTPAGTRTLPPSPTRFPTSGVIATSPGVGFVPTATPFRLNPTSTFFAVSPAPFIVDLAYPVDGSQVAGYLTLIGSASHPRMAYYVIEFGPHPNPSNLWYPFSGQRTTPVVNGPLAAWDTTTVQDGSYQIRLHVKLIDGTDLDDIVGDIRVSNRKPTVAPPNPPTQRPNQPPAISPIGSQQVNSGASVKVSITTSDPNGDQVNLFVSSDNPSIATALVSGASEVTVNGVTKGAATITVTANDNHGGTANAAFVVTVQGQNQAPKLNPITNQTINVSESRDLPVTASDPDGDSLTLTVSSDNTGIVSASAVGNNTVRFAGVAAGTANVTVTVSDGKGGSINSIFQVVVGQPNRAPTVDPVGDQTMDAGATLDVTYNASDPDGDTLTPLATSGDENVVTATITQPGTIHLEGKSGGTATVTLAISDGKNPVVEATFNVTVNSPNLPPTIDPIGDQELAVGTPLDVSYTATDPEGDSLNVTASSSNESVVTAAVVSPGMVTLNAAGAGTAVVSVYAEDGINPAASVSFNVTVKSSNNNPTVDPIGEQAVSVGNSITIPVSASDPDGNPLAVAATSDAPNIATANASGMDVMVTGVGPGEATVYVDVTDDQGGMVSTSFKVVVTGTNNPPVIDPPVADQQVAVNEGITVPVPVSDPDGDMVTLIAISQNSGVVNASAVDNNSVLLQGVAEGTAAVELTADDGNGGVTKATFNVTVSAAAQTFNLMDYPVLPQIDQQDAAMLNQVYLGGVTSFGNQANAFSKVGDDALDNPAFMAPFATPGNYELGNTFAGLQALIDAYAATPVRPDGTTNSFNADSVAAGGGYAIDTVTGPAPTDAVCDGTGTLLTCEYKATKPSIALISFGASNVVFMDPAVFRSELQSVVNESLTSGVIPVLATIPAGNGYTTEQLAPFNQAIVEVATQAGVPLWNLWRAMQEQGVADPNSSAPEGPANLNILNYGYNIRNLTALQVLQTVRQAAGIQ